MSKQKLTDWFPADIKPARAGVYNTRCDWGSGYSHWNGLQWGNQYTFPENSHRYGAQDRGDQRKEWRGLTEPADAAQ